MTCLRKLLTPVQVQERRLFRLAEEAARKLLNEPMPSMPPYTGNSPKEFGAYRIQEINMKTDVGYPWSTGPRTAEHHMRNAISTIQIFLNHWAFNVAQGPIKEAFALPAGIVIGLRERLDPALYVAIAELDEGSELSCEYDQLEATTLDQIETTLAGYTGIPARCRGSRITKQVTTELENAVQEHYAGLLKLQQKLESGFFKITSQELLA